MQTSKLQGFLSVFDLLLFPPSSMGEVIFCRYEEERRSQGLELADPVQSP